MLAAPKVAIAGNKAPVPGQGPGGNNGMLRSRLAAYCDMICLLFKKQHSIFWLMFTY